MNIDTQRKTAAILQTIAAIGKPIGSSKIANDLRLQGIDLKERTIRYYLEQTDRLGFTENLGRKGRRITELGRQEIASAVAVHRVSFISDRFDDFAYKPTFDLKSRQGTVILNVSTLPMSNIKKNSKILRDVLDAGLGMGRFLAIAKSETLLAGRHLVPKGKVVIATLCSVTLNGVLQSNGIPVRAKFGGLLEMRERKPLRFTQIVNYDSTTIDPIEIFIKGKMTRVYETVRTGNGTVGASFREIPAAALPKATEFIQALDRIGLGGVLALGEPGRPLLDVPISENRVGLVVAVGLNAIAALEEKGVPTESTTMGILSDFDELIPASKL